MHEAARVHGATNQIPDVHFLVQVSLKKNFKSGQ